ncbi:MAG: BrxA/BrxB family bacilliredoxin [Bacteroidetes bacterium QH_2_67_10]|nr:MAG: BrxA/BrxB family bacilliredoxin [Bacteroidetes bacterium QH_2_67_10]PSQ70966.1 MAG: BrxA/BrxB family bacilliredoxin [Bacteroidetes bacterium QH_9_67_14]
MPYPEAMVQPMREELTRLGVDELTTAEEVDDAFDAADDGTMLLVINSVCGCAASNARPAVAMARQSGGVQPERYVTVFAGQDLEATAQAREKLPGVPPSSPFMALFKDGQPVSVIERRDIEGRSAQAIASDLTGAFEQHCAGGDGAAGNGAQPPEAASTTEGDASGESASEEHTDELPDTFRSIT